MMIHDGNSYFDFIEKPNFEHNSYISYNYAKNSNLFLLFQEYKRYDLS